MGFCLVNNVAVTAAALAEQGERVLIVDYDAHHGNGTQDIFYEHPTVFYVSFHQWPLYPGTGGMAERGEGAGFGCNLNIPLPPGDRRGLPGGHRPDRGPARRIVRADVAHHLRRVRRPPSRPDHRPRPHLGRLRR